MRMAKFEALYQGAHRRVFIMRGGAERVRKTFVADSSLFGEPRETFSAPQGFLKRNTILAHVAERFFGMRESGPAMKAARGEKEVEKAREHCFSIATIVALVCARWLPLELPARVLVGTFGLTLLLRRLADQDPCPFGLRPAPASTHYALSCSKIEYK